MNWASCTIFDFYRSSRGRTDLDRKLLWLAKAAKGSAKLCIDRGRAADLLNALGLQIDSEGQLITLGPTGPN